uniref:alpha-tocopherol transfer protein-like n=1 Tax=Ciona intestinalis TaxID=7719 RepID=UPI000180C9E7|nr:alpha-tocopherol transfer protein-like [Ciona intestinalis]|eukprot:XP_002124926.1 alpha-tocopherol transfer protein-like [Ciona intestinalis]
MDITMRYECSLSPPMLARAIAELNEPDNNLDRLKAIDRLKVNFDVEKYGPLLKEDDAFILRFLRARKFDQRKALKLLQKYHTIRTELPEVFNRVKEPERLAAIMNSGTLYFSNGRTKTGSWVLMFKPGPMNDIISAYDVVAYSVLCIEKLLENEEYQICGSITIDDLKDFNLTSLSPSSKLKKMFDLWQDSMPIRIMPIHILNESKVFSALFKLIQPFMKKKIKQKLRLHGNCFAELHDSVEKHLLPSCLGGTGPDPVEASAIWLQQLSEM